MDSTYINLDTLRRRRRRRLFEVEGLELHWDTVNLDWCAGHNPSLSLVISVDCFACGGLFSEDWFSI
jgi:hypothetical protein